MWRILSLTLFAFVAFTSAQRITTIDALGETLIETISTDEWEELWTITLTTKGIKAATITASTSTTTSGLTTSPKLTSVTHSVAAGTIEDYSSYQTSISAALKSMSSSAWEAYISTATEFGIKQSQSSSASSPRRILPEISLVAGTLVSLGLAWGVGMVLLS